MVGFINGPDCCFAGQHLLVDLFDCKHTEKMKAIENIMVEACKATGATVLFSHSHPFSGGGSSGAVILAESHGTWHSWTEENFIAIDIFVCGDCEPTNAIEILKSFFEPTTISIKLEKRGIKSS